LLYKGNIEKYTALYSLMNFKKGANFRSELALSSLPFLD